MPIEQLATNVWSPPDGNPVAGTVVLVHGVTGWHRTWWRVGPALAAAGFRAVGVDLRGHGHSPRIDGIANVSELAADVGAVVDRLDPPVTAIVGHSLGGAVTAELAHERPDLAHRLVLEDPPAVTRADDVAWQANLERELLEAAADPEAAIARELAANPTWVDEDARQNVEGRQLADRSGLLAMFRRDTGARVLDLAPRLTVPALYVLAAEGRSVLWSEHRRRLIESVPAHSRVAVADAGHTVHRDAPDWYIATLLEWIAA